MSGIQILDLNQISKSTPKSIVDSLPLREMTAEQVKQCQNNEDEGNRKCMVCFVEYEEADKVRTMPCMHFFH